MLKAIDERRQRMVLFPEPSDGVPLRFKFPNGIMKTRKFMMSESIQVMCHSMMFCLWYLNITANLSSLGKIHQSDIEMK